MGGILELTYCDLRCKEIINAVDGKRLGRILDMVFTLKGEILGIVAPYGRKGLLFKTQEVFIPWQCIKKIGEDVILVELPGSFSHAHKDKRHKEKPHGEGKYGHYVYDDYDEQYRNHYNKPPPCHDKPMDDCKDDHYRGRDNCGNDHHDHHDHDHRDHHDHHDHHGNHDHHDYHKNRGRDGDCDEHRHKGHGGGYDECRYDHMPNCDRRCEKCMLFDCIHRWRDGEGIFVDNKKYNDKK